MNKRNLTKLLKHLEKQRNSKASAGRFNMAYWGESVETASQVLETPVCKTQACMAGEATIALSATEFLKDGGLQLTVAAQKKFPGMWSISGVAGELLGLTDDQKLRLFYLKSWGYSQGWPEKYETAYRDATTPRARLTAAINRLKHFIKTDGAE